MAFSEDLSFLRKWFSDYGSSKLYEIEARVKDAEAEYDSLVDVFDALLPTPTRTETVDESAEGGVRRTQDSSGGVAFMTKRRIDVRDVSVGDVRVRFSLTQEQPVQAPARFMPTHFRVKDRRSYLIDGSVAIELTGVRSGASTVDARRARPAGEVELEWMGHAEFAHASPDWWARNFEYKVLYVVQQLVRLRSA